MSRKRAREIAMTKLYEMEIHQEYFLKPNTEKEIARFVSDGREVKYAIKLIKRFTENKGIIDGTIKKFSEKWDINRLSKVDLSIIRLALTEIFYDDDIPDSVSINEAVNLARKFSDEESFKFVNGILGNILRSRQ